MRGIDVTVVAFARTSGGRAASGRVSGSAASPRPGRRPGRGRRRGGPRRRPGRATRTTWSAGTADADWDDAPGETDIHVFDAFAPALGEAFGRARAGGRILYGFVDHDVTTTYVGSSTGLRLRHEQPTGHYALHRQDAGPRRAAPGSAARPATSPASTRSRSRRRSRSGSAGRERTVDLPAGRYDTILPPAAVADLMIDAYWYAGARDAHDGQSVYSRRGGGTRIGEEMVRPEVTLSSDPAYPGLECAPRSWWRRPATTSRSSTTACRSAARPGSTDGRLAALRQTRETAALTGQPVTPAIDNLVLEVDGATGSLDDLVAGTERGLLLTCLWYIRAVDPQTLLLTGLTRDGVYLVENGEITGAVNNFRFNESPVDLLRRFTHASATGPALQPRVGRRLLLPHRHARAARARLQHVERLAGAVADPPTDVETGQSSSASANASGGGQEHTRWRSPYAWSMRATGGQYLSGSGPVGKTATSRG